jgi:hypothetical protein
MYCRLLQSVTARMTDRPEGVLPRPEEEDLDLALGVQAFLPDDYVEDPRTRLEVLREMDRALSREVYDEVRAALADRFGPWPPQASDLLGLFLIKHLLRPHQVRLVQRVPPDQLLVRHRPSQPLSGDWLAFFPEVRPVEPGRTHLVLPRAVREPGAVLQFLMGALLGDAEASRLAQRGGSSRRGGGFSSRSTASQRRTRRPRD